MALEGPLKHERVKDSLQGHRTVWEDPGPSKECQKEIKVHMLSLLWAVGSTAYNVWKIFYYF